MSRMLPHTVKILSLLADGKERTIKEIWEQCRDAVPPQYAIRCAEGHRAALAKYQRRRWGYGRDYAPREAWRKDDINVGSRLGIGRILNSMAAKKRLIRTAPGTYKIREHTAK